MKESETHFLLDLDYITYKFFLSQAYFLPSLVGEPKSRIMQKHTFFAPERYTAGILYTDILNSA